MILGDPEKRSELGSDPTTTLDVLLARAVARRPDEVALADPPNRASFMHGSPRCLSFAEADCIVSAIAARLRWLGLPTDAVVGIQLPNTVECALSILGVLRAGMIAAPLPLLWRRTELSKALGRVAAKAIITAGSVGDAELCIHAREAAVEIFQIRYVCGFGPKLPDGVIPFDDLLLGRPVEPSAGQRDSDPAAHVAVVTVEVSHDGPILVARNHIELIAGGLAAMLEGGIPRDARLLGCCAMSSFAGLALTLLPWLLTGGTLSLHHGFSAEAFAAQCGTDRCDTVAVPGPLVPRLSEAGLLAHPKLKNVLALWRAPESFANASPWQSADVALTDMLAFGEIALLGSRRGASGAPMPLASGKIFAPRGAAAGSLVAEMARSEAGTVMLRGPMVPGHAFPPGAELGSGPCLKASADGFVDTRYSCRLDPATDTFVVTAPPPGVIAVGGYRFALGELEQQVRHADNGAFVTALPDALAGHRLAGISATGEARTALQDFGVNPLLTEAFDNRCKPKAA